MKIAIGSDHGGYELKVQLIGSLKAGGHEIEDLGAHSKESSDYPLIGFEVAKAVSEGRAERGILICKTGVGMTIIANKVSCVRAAACYDVDLARSSREHNDCNVLVLAAHYTDFEKASQIVQVWLTAQHLGDRHQRRVQQINDIETRQQ